MKYNCKKNTNCEICAHKADGSLTFCEKSKGEHIPMEKSSQNEFIFVISGTLLVNSEEYPGEELHAGQVILQAIGSKLEGLALTDVCYMVYRFSRLPIDCESLYKNDNGNEFENEPITYTPLKVIPKLSRILDDIKCYLEENITCCQYYLDIKCRELVFVMLSNYPSSQMANFLFPISNYTQEFHFFVTQNYAKIHSVEEFAHLGGYNISTFRRLFRNLYGVPVYEWILQKKREMILTELQQGTGKLNELSSRYGFDSPSHFAHFCKESFGDTPRNIRNRSKNGEIFKVIINKKQLEEDVADERVSENEMSKKKAGRPRKNKQLIEKGTNLKIV